MKAGKACGLAGFLLVVAGLATLFAVLRENLVLEPYHFIEAQGQLGALCLCLFMVLWIVCGFPSTIIEVLAGFMYGFGWGVLIGFVGKQVAATISFTIGRRLALRWSTRLQKRYLLLRAMNTALRECTRRVLFLVCIAYIPAAIKNYGLALFENVSFANFSLATALTGTPYVLMSTWFGATSYSIIEVVKQQRRPEASGAQGETVSGLKIAMMCIGGVSSAVLLVILAIYGRRARRELIEHAELEDAAALEAAALAAAALREQQARASFDFVKLRLPLDDSCVRVQGKHHVPPVARRDRTLRRSLSANSRLAHPPSHYHDCPAESDYVVFPATRARSLPKRSLSPVETSVTADVATLSNAALKYQPKSLRDSRPIPILPPLELKSSSSGSSGGSESISVEVKEEKSAEEEHTVPPVPAKPVVVSAPHDAEPSVSQSRAELKPALTFWEMLEAEDSVRSPTNAEKSVAEQQLDNGKPSFPETRLDIHQPTLGVKLGPTTIKLSPRRPSSHGFAREKLVRHAQRGAFARSSTQPPAPPAPIPHSKEKRSISHTKGTRPIPHSIEKRPPPKPSRWPAFRPFRSKSKKPRKLSKRIKEAQAKLAQTSHIYGSPDKKSHCRKHSDVQAHLERERQYRYLAKMLAGAVPAEPAEPVCTMSEASAKAYRRHRRSSVM